MRGAAEHAAQVVDVGMGTDSQTKAARAPPAGLGQRAPRVGRTVGALVAVVVGQAIGQHDQQPPRRPAPSFQHRRAVPDRRAEPRVRARYERVKTAHDQHVEVVVEALHRHHLHGGAPLRVKGVQRHAIAEVVQRDGQRRGGRSLLLVHCLARRARFGDRARDIEQEKNGEVAPASKAVQIDRFVRRRPRHQLDACFDRGVDVDVVALGLAATLFEAHTQACERAAQVVAVRQIKHCNIFGRNADFPHGAPGRPVTLSMNIPFGICDGVRVAGDGFLRLVGLCTGHHRDPASRHARADSVRRRVRAGSAAFTEVADDTEHPAQQAAEAAATADRTGEEIRTSADTVVFIFVEFGQRDVVLPPRSMLTTSGRRAWRLIVRSQQLSRADDPELAGRIGDCVAAQCHGQRLGGRLALGTGPVDERS